jgi:hypothetical protein
MTSLRVQFVCGFSAILLSGHLLAEDVTRQEAQEMMLECQSERELNIAPLKDKAIKDCIDGGRGDRDYCERYNRNYGERTTGGSNRGLFWELPVCEKAIEAEKYFKMNPGKAVYRASP